MSLHPFVLVGLSPSFSSCDHLQLSLELVVGKNLAFDFQWLDIGFINDCANVVPDLITHSTYFQSLMLKSLGPLYALIIGMDIFTILWSHLRNFD